MSIWSTRRKKISVNELSKLLGVSEVTIRKDLTSLAESGIITREHGYALKKDYADIRNRMSVNYLTKYKIAERALALVEEGETIMIGSGSTCALLAELIAVNRPKVTIITHSSYIAEHVSKSGNNPIVLLGGVYQNNSQVNVGPLIDICAREFYVDKIFIGTDGFVKDVGFMGSDILRSEAIQTMSESARHTIMLTDSSKFNQRGTIVQFKPFAISTLITDDGVSQDLIDYFTKFHIETIIVKREVPKPETEEKK